MATGNAIVVGGGIGGLSAAAAMTREGWTVTVLKQAPAFGAVGAGIALAPKCGASVGLAWPGRRAPRSGHGAGRRRHQDRLRPLAAANPDRGAAAAVRGADVRLAPLRPAQDADGRQQRSRPAHRPPGDLGRPRHGSAVTTYDGPYGQGTATADLVVAADVVHSRLRAVLFPEHAGPTDAGYITWRGLVPARRRRRSGSTRL